MSNEITSTHELAEADGEDREVDSDITATRDAENAPIEFHVQMRSYTQREMERLIVEAAAALIVGRHDKRELAKQIETRAIELINERITADLQDLTAEIIDQPVTPAYGDKKPVTMRELIGLTGREFLTAKVDGRGRAQGEKDYDSYYKHEHGYRIAFLVRQAMDSKFKDEIAKATAAAVNEFRAELRKSHEAIVAAEMTRFREALSAAASK